MFLLPHGSQNCTVTAIAADALTIESSQAGVPCASPNLGAESYHNPHSTLRRKTETRCQCGGGRCRRCLRCPVAVLLVMSRLEILPSSRPRNRLAPGAELCLVVRAASRSACTRNLFLPPWCKGEPPVWRQEKTPAHPGKAQEHSTPLVSNHKKRHEEWWSLRRNKKQQCHCQLAFPTSRARRKPPRSVAKGAWAVKRSVSQ